MPICQIQFFIVVAISELNAVNLFATPSHPPPLFLTLFIISQFSPCMQIYAKRENFFRYIVCAPNQKCIMARQQRL
jgi:hypothetical protein